MFIIVAAIIIAYVIIKIAGPVGRYIGFPLVATFMVAYHFPDYPTLIGATFWVLLALNALSLQSPRIIASIKKQQADPSV
jgi:hypothetical protein